MKQLIIMRGITGAGKTYITRQFSEATICSADDYFKEDAEVVDWDWRELPTAHEYCKEQFQMALEREDELIIIDNTNLWLKDMKPYILGGMIHEYQIGIMQVDCPPEIAQKRSKHRFKIRREQLVRQIKHMDSESLPTNIPIMKRSGYVEYRRAR